MKDSGEAPVPRSRTCLEDAALHNLLPHLYLRRLRIPGENVITKNLKRTTEDGEKGT